MWAIHLRRRLYCFLFSTGRHLEGAISKYSIVALLLKYDTSRLEKGLNVPRAWRSSQTGLGHIVITECKSRSTISEFVLRHLFSLAQQSPEAI